MKKLYEAVPVEEALPEIKGYYFTLVGREFHDKDYFNGEIFINSNPKFWLREVGSSVSTEDIIEMIDEEISNENALWEKSPSAITSSQHASAVNVLSNLRSRITAKEKPLNTHNP